MGRTFENEQPNRRAAFISWRWLAIASFLIIALIVGILIANKARGSDVDRGTRALIEAFSKQRLIEPRLSGGFKGGEFRPSHEDLSGIKTKEYELARDLITDAAAKGDSSAQLPYARLLLSKSEQLPEALKYLRRAVASSPESSEAHNDLGVCFIQQGKLEDAIDEFEAALKYRADMPEALFNRALCYQRLLLWDAGSADLARLLQIDRDRSWLSEINLRQQEVSAPLAPQKKETDIVAAFDTALATGNLDEANRITDKNLEVIIKQASYEYPVKYLGELVAGNHEQAERVLSEIEQIGRRFVEIKNDTSIVDLAEYLHSLPDREREKELGLIKDFREAEGLVSLKKYDEAKSAFEELGKAFAKRANYVFQDFSTYYKCSCYYATGHLRLAIQMMKEAFADTQSHKWPYSRAQLSCQLGIAYSRLGRDSLAIKVCEQALADGQGLFLLEAKTLQYMGNSYWHVGSLENGLACFRKSAGFYLDSVPTPYELAYNYLHIAEIYRLRGNHSLGLLYAKQALSFLQQANDNNRAAQTASFLAVEHARLGQFDEAASELDLARDYAERTERGQRAYTDPLILTRAGQVAALRGDLARAEGYYSEAAAQIERREGKTIPLMRALQGRAEVYAQAKDFEKARLDLERAMSLIEGYRANINESENRSAFLDASQAVFDQMIQLNIGAFGNHGAAFAYSEQARARTLLDEISSPLPAADLTSRQREAKGYAPRKQVRPLRLAEVQRALPDDSRLLTYSVTDQRTYLFLVTRSGLEVVESPATTEILDRLVQEYLSGLKNKVALEDLSAQATKLYEYLIEPVEGQLRDGKTLCIVPDKALHFLPFAGLVDRSGEYLIKSYRLTYAPSASVLARCIEEARVKAESIDEEILAVGNPLFDHDAFPTLANLEAAEREASESAASYPKSVILKGADATEDQVRAALKDCDVAHLAVHCLVEEKSPWLAALVLTNPGVGGQRLGSGGESSPDDGMLYLNEVYGISLPRTRLVVLSACQSGLGQYYRGEGIVSLIHPFLALRVPTVVASLWSVDSGATAELMIQFHRERKANNIGAGDALQAAQIRMIRSAEYQHPYYWAPFVSVGAN